MNDFTGGGHRRGDGEGAVEWSWYCPAPQKNIFPFALFLFVFLRIKVYCWKCQDGEVTLPIIEDGIEICSLEGKKVTFLPQTREKKK